MPFNALKRQPLGALSELKRFFYNAFILPCKDVQRAYLYFTSVIFSFSGAFLDLFIVIDLMKMDIMQMIYYLLIKNAGVSFLICLIFWMITKFGGKVIYPFITAMLSCAMVFCLFWPYHLGAIELGIIFMLINAPFWALYHVFFAISISDENVGNEVALAGTGLTVGMAIGTLAGGFIQAFDAGFYALVFGFTGMTIGTVMLIIHANKMTLRDFLIASGALNETLWEAFRRCKYRSLGSIFEGILQVGGGSLWFIFLSLSGIGASAVGIWAGLMVMIKVIFTPICGSLINHGQRREMLMGSGVTLIGWLPFVFTTTFALPAMYIWSVGNQLFSSGLSSAWYKSRTVASLMAREMILGIVRLICIPGMIFILYHSTDYFIYFMIAISFMMTIYSIYWMKSIKIKGPVMPIETNVSMR